MNMYMICDLSCIQFVSLLMNQSCYAWYLLPTSVFAKSSLHTLAVMLLNTNSLQMGLHTSVENRLNEKVLK